MRCAGKAGDTKTLREDESSAGRHADVTSRDEEPTLEEPFILRLSTHRDTFCKQPAVKLRGGKSMQRLIDEQRLLQAGSRGDKRDIFSKCPPESNGANQLTSSGQVSGQQTVCFPALSHFSTSRGTF